MAPSRTEIRLWYAACAVLGIPWWMLIDLPIGALATGYLGAWVALILRTWRLQWGRHRNLGILLAASMNLAIFLSVLFYLGARYGDDPKYF